MEDTPPSRRISLLKAESEVGARWHACLEVQEAQGPGVHVSGLSLRSDELRVINSCLFGR